MRRREFESCEPRWAGPRGRGETPQNEEPRAAVTHARLKENIDKAIDEQQDTGNRPQPQPYPVRHLISRYSVSAAIAGVFAAELGMGGG